MSSFNLMIGMCLLVGHDWIYTDTHRVYLTCDLAERM